jgi:phosphohistidine phosphatase SixA
VEGAVSPIRPLSRKGRRQAALLARFLKRNGALDVDAMWHSPLVRSVETAGIVGRDLGLTVPCVEMAGLEPFDPPGPMEDRIMAFGRNLAIVGHEPQLSALAGLLLGQGKKAVAIEMKKGACLALEHAPEGWRLRWLITPKLLGGKLPRG